MNDGEDASVGATVTQKQSGVVKRDRRITAEIIRKVKDN